MRTTRSCALTSAWVLCLALLSPAMADPPPIRAQIMAGAEGSFDGANLSLGFDHTLGASLDGNGWILRGSGSYGRSSWPAFGLGGMDDQVSGGRVMIGHRQSDQGGTLTLFAGVAAETRAVDWGDRRTGLRIGPALALDAWLTPLPRVAIAVFAQATTAHWAATVRLAPSFEVTSGLHVGPEVTWSRHHGAERWRLGGFIQKALPSGMGLRLAIGRAHDPQGRAGAYGALALWRRY